MLTGAMLQASQAPPLWRTASQSDDSVSRWCRCNLRFKCRATQNQILVFFHLLTPCPSLFQSYATAMLSAIHINRDVWLLKCERLFYRNAILTCVMSNVTELDQETIPTCRRCLSS